MSAMRPSSVQSGVYLQVGERRFITTEETLTDESPFFSSLLRHPHEAQADGSYFIDVDPDVFEHVLRYLRHGVLPVFYDNAKGHDHALYHLLLQQARYFQIERLRRWLVCRKYLDAVQTTITVEEVDHMYELSQPTGAHVEVEYHPIWKRNVVHMCPRGIDEYESDSSASSMQYMSLQGDEGKTFEEEEVPGMLVIRKETVFDPELCMSYSIFN
ncbi:hypothetical protein MMC22_004025 [Lobaria immixta]|nr:hypothetical protein [Lobaria immixta]